MKSLTFLLALIVCLLLFVNAYRLESNKDLQEQFLNDAEQGQLENLIHQRRMELRKLLQQYRANAFDDDSDSERTYDRRKVVGLGDNPFK